MKKYIGRRPREIKAGEFPEEVERFIIWDSFRLEVVPNRSSNRLVVDRICSVCNNVYTSVVTNMRTDFKRRGRSTTFCSDCNTKPGEHLRGLRRRAGVNGYINAHGYRLLYRPDYKGSMRSGHVLEHRYVMEQELGRRLSKDESVHHINGDRTDNRIENLQLRKKYHGKGQKWTCGDCGSRNVVPTDL